MSCIIYVQYLNLSNKMNFHLSLNLCQVFIPNKWSNKTVLLRDRVVLPPASWWSAGWPIIPSISWFWRAVRSKPSWISRVPQISGVSWTSGWHAPVWRPPVWWGAHVQWQGGHSAVPPPIWGPPLSLVNRQSESITALHPSEYGR